VKLRRVPAGLDALLLAAASLPPILINLVDIDGNRLWYDELQSITHATRPWPALIPSVIIYDEHGPVSYIMVKIWSLLDQELTFLLLSSSAAIVVSLLFIYSYGKRLLGRKLAFVAALIFGISPMAVRWATHLRPYPWLILLSLVFLYANCLLLARRAGLAALVLMITSGVLLAYTHVAGIFFLATISLPALVQTLRQRSSPWSWLAGHLAVAVLAIPVILRATPGNLGHREDAITIVPGWADIVRAVGMFAAGYYDEGQLGLLVVASALTLVIVLAGLLDRRPVVACVAGCVALSFAAALAISPFRLIWDGVRLFAYLTPFVAILTAACLTGGQGQPPLLSAVARASAAAAVVLSAWGTTAFYREHGKPGAYWSSVQVVTRGMSDGDIVVTDNIRKAWGIRWYLAGATWQAGLYGKIHVADDLDGLRRWNAGHLRKTLAQYDFQPDTTKPKIFVVNSTREATELDRAMLADLTNIEHLWLIADNAAAIDEMIKTMAWQSYEVTNYEGTDPLVVRLTVRR
jgi:hypothetical protein